jgi:hypothetical protein
LTFKLFYFDIKTELAVVFTFFKIYIVF